MADFVEKRESDKVGLDLEEREVENYPHPYQAQNDEDTESPFRHPSGLIRDWEMDLGSNSSYDTETR
jgi:hypothetical protein